jgi:hypothetical protein
MSVTIPASLSCGSRTFLVADNSSQLSYGRFVGAIKSVPEATVPAWG